MVSFALGGGVRVLENLGGYTLADFLARSALKPGGDIVTPGAAQPGRLPGYALYSAGIFENFGVRDNTPADFLCEGLAAPLY